jgi:hypothetical protein
MLEHLKKFIGDIIITGCNAQISTLQKVLGLASDEKSLKIVDSHQNEDVYILGGVDPKKQTRAGDDDIVSKNYFFLDFDIRNDYKDRNNADIADDEIKKIGGYIIEKMASHDLLKLWSYMVFTGNGVHVYYFGEPCKVENKRWWSMGVNKMIQEAFRITGIQPDIGCKNVARISRLPGSYNNKNGAHKLVEIINVQEAKFPICTIQKMGEGADSKVKPEQKAQSQVSPESTIEVINEIPIGDLVCELTGWSLDTDKVHFIDGSSSKQKACFIADKGNFLVHGGTDHLPHKATGFAPFEFVRAQLNLSAADTFSWFKKKYPQVRTASKNEAEK